MKQLQQPNVPDVANLRSLANNQALASFPALRTNTQAILRSYVAYRRVTGNAIAAGAPVALGLNNVLADALRQHYTRPPTAIRPFLKTLRDAGSPDVCPMCGSLGTGTLDHIFPKANFPEFVFFSLNLVPACICNSKRQDNLAGAGPGQRVLHPYYDGILAQRLARAHIQPSPQHGFRRPVLQLEVLLPNTDPNYAAVSYHIDKVIRPTQVLAHFDANWPKVARRPEHYFTLPAGQVSDQMLAHAVADALNKKDIHYGSRNNWESMLFAGIAANAAAITFLVQRVNDLRNNVVNPQDF
jgi:hypothetical protein